MTQDSDNPPATTPDHDDAPPSAVRAELERLLAAPRFRRAPRLTELLRYVVERTLAGEAKAIKAYAIAIDVFDRDARFDPATDSLVRVEMGRLRRTLEEHYAQEGADAALRIVIPRGTYVPRFVPRAPRSPQAGHEAAPAATAPAGTGPQAPVSPSSPRAPSSPGAPNASRAPAARRAPLTAIGALALLAGALAFAVLAATFANLHHQHRLAAAITAAAAMPGGPTLAVTPIRAAPDDDETRTLAEGFTIGLAGRLAAFRRLVVLAPRSAARIAADHQPPAAIRRRYPALLALGGRLRRDRHGLHLDLALVDLSSGRLAWSRRYDVPADAGAVLPALDDLATEVAATLGQGEGVIERTVADGPLARLKSMESFLCVARFYRYLRDKSAAAHARVRACLEDVVRRETCYSDAWAALSWIYADERRLGYNPRPGAEPPLSRALAAGERAVACDPDNAVAWLYRGKSLFALHRDAAARTDIAHALELNAGDADLLAHAGTTLALLGDWRQGMALMDKAFRLNPYAPRWYHGIRFLNAFRRGDAAAALVAARAYFRPGILLSHGYLVAALARAGRAAEAATARRRMLEAFPDAARTLPAQMRLWRVPADLAADILRAIGDLRGVSQG